MIQYDRDPIIVHRILIGFEAILENTFFFFFLLLLLSLLSSSSELFFPFFFFGDLLAL